jgi:hypothetical protein
MSVNSTFDNLFLGTTIMNTNSVLNIDGNISLNTDKYITFGTDNENNSFGIRDNNGNIEYKDLNGNWRAINTYNIVDIHDSYFTTDRLNLENLNKDGNNDDYLMIINGETKWNKLIITNPYILNTNDFEFEMDNDTNNTNYKILSKKDNTNSRNMILGYNDIDKNFKIEYLSINNTLNNVGITNFYVDNVNMMSLSRANQNIQVN